MVLRSERGCGIAFRYGKSNFMAETSLHVVTMERDENLRRTEASLQVEARPAAAETPSMDNGVHLVSTQAQDDTQQESPAGEEARGETLESQINAQQNRRHFLRQMQKDTVASINAYAVVLVLLASVTFIGFLQPPGGLDAAGYLERQGRSMKDYIICIATAFYLAVVGILVCMSCIAFVLPRATTYAGRSVIAKMKPKYSSVGPGLNSHDLTNVLEFEVKNNDKISRALKLTYMHEILANLFFVVSLSLTVRAFATSAEVVINRKELDELKSHFYWKIINATLISVFRLYLFILLLNFVKAGHDLVVDLLKGAKRLSFRSVTRFGTFRKLR